MCPSQTHYDDLPPSYDQAQEQAMADARDGIAPIDPSHLEAHRLTTNQDANEPEVWEYRIRGEESTIADDREPAPEYRGPPIYSASTEPVGRAALEENVVDGKSTSGTTQPTGAIPSMSGVVDQALDFIQHAPPANIHAARLSRRIAIPQLVASEQQQRLPSNSVQFLRAYPQVLNSHNIRSVDFLGFLDGLNATCRTVAYNALPEPDPDVLHDSTVGSYMETANELFFHPRGLFVSLQSSTTLLCKLSIPENQDHRDNAIAMTLHRASSADQRAQALYPWISELDLTAHPASTLNSSVHTTHGLGHASLVQEPSRTGFSNYEGGTAQSRRAFESPGPAVTRPKFCDGENHTQKTRKKSEECSQNMGQSSKQFGTTLRGGSLGDEQCGTGKAAAKTSGSYQPSVGLGVVQSSATDVVNQKSPRHDVHTNPNYRKANADGLAKQKGNAKAPESSIYYGEHDHYDEDSDDSSSLSSIDTESDPIYASGDEEWSNAEINVQQHRRRLSGLADIATNQGKNSSKKPSQEHSIDIELAQAKKAAMEAQIEGQASKRATLHDLKQQGRDLKELSRQNKKDLRAAYDSNHKRKVKKSREWREAKEEYRVQRRQMREEMRAARTEERAVKRDTRKARRRDRVPHDTMGEIKILWVVVDNLNQQEIWNKVDHGAGEPSIFAL